MWRLLLICILYGGSALPVFALDDFGAVPAFELRNQESAVFNTDKLQGRVSVLGFIFTRCRGQCPLITQEMLRIEDTFIHPALQLIAVSVDPSFDQPEVLQAYAQHIGANPPRWQFLTGDDAAIRSLAQGLLLGVSDGGTPEEPITHSARLVLVDETGRVRGYYSIFDPEHLVALRRDLAQLLKAP
jgi:protein SCO1/2